MIFDPISTVVSLIIEAIGKFENKERVEERPMKKKNGSNLGDKFFYGMAIWSKGDDNKIFVKSQETVQIRAFHHFEELAEWQVFLSY